MPIGLTNEERQRMAFALLRDQARSAHLQGDGLRVANLVETAVQQLEELLSNKQFLLSVAEIQWIIIFRLYWLITRYSCQTTETLLNNLVALNERDADVLQYLRVYHYLISNPLGDGPEAIEKIDAINTESFGLDPEVETRELVRHFVELAWFRTPAKEEWKQVVKKWNNVRGSWVPNVLEGIEKRLSIQTRLTVPSQKLPPYTEKDLAALRDESPLAELWALHLMGETEKLHQSLASFELSSSSRSTEWRTITDYWHTNEGRFGNERSKTESYQRPKIAYQADVNGAVGSRSVVSSEPSATKQQPQDTEAVWLARRRFMSSDSLFLRFCDYREGRIDECCHELFRKRDPGNASVRFEIWQLAMLHELASLRMWDFGLWRSATKAQGESLLEAIQWESRDLEYIPSAIALLINALSICSPKKDWLIKSALDRLEFATVDSRRTIIDACLYSYTRAYYGVSDLLEYYADFAPVDTLEALAEWTVSFAAACRDRRTSGWKLNCLTLWREIICIIPINSCVWSILRAEVLQMATFSYGWRSGDERAILKSWLCWAPIEDAKKLVIKLLQTENADYGNRIGRATLAIEVEELRPELNAIFSQQLLVSTSDAVEQNILCRSTETTPPAGGSELKTRVISGIYAALEKAAPSDPNTAMSFGPFPAGIVEVKEWNLEDATLIKKLIETINSDRVHRAWLGWLLNTLQLIASKGTSDVANMIAPEVMKWSKKLPEGKSLVSPMNGPWSVMQMGESSDSELMLGLGWLAFQLVRKANESGSTPFLQWVEAALMSDHKGSFSIALYGSAIVAAKTDGLIQERALFAFEICFNSLLTSMNDASVAEALGAGLRYISSIFLKDKTEFIDWLTPAGARAFAKLNDLLENTAFRLSMARESSIRKGLGSLFWNLKQWSDLKPASLQAWQALANDGRASVRMSAHGGWATEMRRRSSAAI